MKRLRILVTIALLLMPQIAHSAGNQGAGIEGKVVDQYRKPLAGIAVRAGNTKPTLKGNSTYFSVVTSTKTKADGSFALTGLIPASNYTIVLDGWSVCNSKVASISILAPSVGKVTHLKENIVAVMSLQYSEFKFIDPKKKLEWAYLGEGQIGICDADWDKANQFAQNQGGGWRLPTMAELRTIYNRFCDDNIAIPFHVEEAVWSSEIEEPANARAFNFARGEGGAFPRASKNCALLVRTPKASGSVIGCEAFSGGLAPVMVQSGDKSKWGFINKTGKMVIKPQFELEYYGEGGSVRTPHFSEGLAAVKVDNKWGFIDKTGKQVIRAQFSAVSAFSDGVAAVVVGNKVGFIDKTGRMAIKPQFEPESGESGWILPQFSEGLAPVAVRVGWKEGWGFIDKTGKMVIDPQFDRVSQFSKGFAPVVLGGKEGFIDKKGQMVETVNKDTYAEPFSDNLTAVKVDDKWGFTDKTGNMVIEPQFDSAYGFSEGLAAVKVNGKCGYIDKTGKMVINFP